MTVRITFKTIFLCILATLFFQAQSLGVVEFKLTELDSPPSDLVWCGPGKESVVILTEDNSVYRSDDRGFSFKKLNEIFTKTAVELENDDQIGKVSRIISSPVDKSLLVFLGTHGINWIGYDCGRKIKALNQGRKIQEFIFHPTEPKWGLASAFTLCEDFKDDEPCHIYKELFVTQDLGDKWDNLASYVVQFDWGVVDESHIAAGIPKERILVTLDPRGKGHQNANGWNYKIDFMYSDDFFKTKKIGVHKGNKFLLSKNFLMVAQVADQATQEVMLLGASSTEKTYHFQIVEASSSKRLREHSYIFLDIPFHSIIIHMNHFGENSKWGHVYTSDHTGLRYSESLKYNIRGEDGKCDFQKVESMEGVYIANIIDNKYMKDEELEYEKEIMEEDSMQEKPHKKAREQLTQYLNFVETRITFNVGGNWKRLVPPNRDVDGKKYLCDEDCYLNLHGPTGVYSHFYSVESAAGIVISNGNIGKYLSHDSEQMSTFLSRDGGHTWFEVRKGSHIYEIGDHGALIVMADDLKPTDSILYTWDEGLTWQELKISKEKVMVKNIVIEPSSTSPHFIIYGEQTKKGQRQGVTVALDFSSLHEPQCRNPDEPNTPNSDYETWIPGDATNELDRCIMGRKMTYIRRKREAECFNGLSFEKKTVSVTCQCTEQDYECDIGYARDTPSDACSPIDKSKIITTPIGELHLAPEICKGTFTVSKGYRKIPGNQCVNGTLFEPMEFSCPSSFLWSFFKYFFLLSVIALIIGLIIYLVNGNLFQQALEFAQEKLKEKQIIKKTDYATLTNDPQTLMEENDHLEPELSIEVKGKKEKKKSQRNKIRKEEDEEAALH